MDNVTRQRRSEIMARIRSRDTQPEITVRRALHRAGFRYRLYDHTLPGRPDLVFVFRRACLFVHGCFWHGCPHCRTGRRTPKSNKTYWIAKLKRNQARDAANRAALEANGWTVLEIWGCQARSVDHLAAIVRKLKRLPVVKLKSRSSAPAPAKARSAGARAPL
jgi:DNA mismatch endonuclease (patch repair protein)